MTKTIVHSAFCAEARSLLEKARAESAVQHPGLRGAAMEALLRDFLKRYLPGRIEAVCGCAVGADGGVSAETDIIVYDKLNCPGVPATTKLIPVDSVICAVEVKATLRPSQIPKAVKDASRLKALERGTTETYTLTPDGGVSPRSQTVSADTHVSLIGFFAGASVEAVARKWHRHYCDVPFGHQIDCIAVIESGFISLGAWHPALGYTRREVGTVGVLSPGHAIPDGNAVLLFPQTCAADWKTRTPIRVGPRVPWAVGSALFVCVDTGEQSLLAWFLSLTGHIGLQMRSDHVPRLAEFVDCFRPKKTVLLPLAIAVDPKRLDKEKEHYVAEAIRHLLWAEFTEDNIRKLEGRSYRRPPTTASNATARKPRQG